MAISPRSPKGRLLIDEAVEFAKTKVDPHSPRFLDEFRDYFFQKSGASGSASSRSTLGQADPSVAIYSDPRFQASAVQLLEAHGRRERVIGGAAVRGNAYSDCVAVGNDFQWGCTGTLIAPNVVVTAGHCTSVATRVFIGNNVNRKGEIIRVDRAIQHPSYHVQHHNDLMVLILEQDVNGVTPRQIANLQEIDSATSGRVVGFGNVDAWGTTGYGIKRFVDLPVVSVSCSGQTNGQDDAVHFGCDQGLELVAGLPLLGRDTCTGDSGGPIYVTSVNAEWVLAGATSRATDSAVHTCGDGGVYARLDIYVDWIESVTGISLN